MEVKFEKLHPLAKAPTRANNSDAGYDLYASRSMTINPMDRAIVPTGIAIEIPKGFYGRIAPRSGLAIKRGMDVLAGVIDSGYRNEVGVVLVNLNIPEALYLQDNKSRALRSAFGSRLRYDIIEGDRVAQLIIERCYNVDWIEEELSDSERGERGFGSSGA